MNKEFRVFNLLNDQFMNTLKNKIKIIHFSGNYILNKNYHPYIDIYYQKLNELKKILKKSSIDKKIILQYLKQIELIVSFKNSKKTDYILQTFCIRKRSFSKDYYPSIKSLIKKALK